MSLILEALKKSEQQRRLGEMPTLGTPALPSRRRRSWLPLAIGLVAVALAVGGWLMMRRPPRSTDEVAPAAPRSAAAGTAAVKPPAAPARPARAETKPASAKPAAGGAIVAAPVVPMPTTDRPGAVALPPNAALVGTPGATKPGGPSRTPAAAPPQPKPTATAPATAATKAPAMSETKAAAAPGAKPGVPNVAAAAPGAKPDARAGSNAATPKPAPAQPRQPVLPSVWDLPYGTRKELPDLKLTMHVFSNDAAERFIVIEGERHVEGDDLGNGVVLREIRADGMVLDFKGQRFLYPRDGR
ncbi:MAG TPA: general secretion pathway protein GspB [Dokdonella sp.]|nr:general secretion pathway protein GspB [Dokdonella sp.]